MTKIFFFIHLKDWRKWQISASCAITQSPKQLTISLDRQENTQDNPGIQDAVSNEKRGSYSQVLPLALEHPEPYTQLQQAQRQSCFRAFQGIYRGRCTDSTGQFYSFFYSPHSFTECTSFVPFLQNGMAPFYEQMKCKLYISSN